MIGRHECGEATTSDLKEALAIGLDEALTALEESIRDLTDEQFRSFPIPARNNIAWIVMHCLQNLDTYANSFQTKESSFTHDRRWDLWDCRPDERPRPEDAFPSQQEALDLLRRTGATARLGLNSASRDDLLGRRHAHEWWGRKTSADAYLRTISHTQAHVRQIWLLRGALGLTDGKNWPQQHWA